MADDPDTNDPADAPQDPDTTTSADAPREPDTTASVDAPREAAGEPRSTPWWRVELTRNQQYGVLVGLVVVAALVLVVGLVLDRDEPPPPPRPDIPLDAWAPYWTLDASVEAAPQRLGSMREVSPFFYNATSVDTIQLDANADVELVDEFLDIARDEDVPVIFSIVDHTEAGEMAGILADPETRTRHVDAIMDFADRQEADGIDLDYEQFAFADGRDSWADTRPNWVAFVEELAAELHATDRTLTVSIPPVYDGGRGNDSGYWVYDHGAIVEHVDRIRIMAYDFSVPDPGPIAPLDFVRRSIEGVLDATGSPDKIVLGLPAYGRNWPTGTTGDCTDLELQGVASINIRTVDELIERRAGTPVFDPETGEWTFDYEFSVVTDETGAADDPDECVQQRQVHYVDADGIALRMDLAREYGLDGVALWAFGFEDESVWDAILPTVEQ